jgi:hypothetical protein
MSHLNHLAPSTGQPWVKPGHDEVGRNVVIKKTNKQGGKAKAPRPRNSSPAKLRPIGLEKGKVWMRDNFDDPLPDEFMKAFE